MLESVIMSPELKELTKSLRAALGGIDTSSMSSSDALSLVEELTELRHVITAAITLAAGRVHATGAWRKTGSSSVVAFLADRSGASFREAAATLSTAHHLSELPVLRKAFLGGRLSGDQASEIALASASDPTAESWLVQVAQHESLAALRERCRDVIAASAGDEGTCERIRRGRFLRHRTDRDGAIRLDARLAPDDAAPLLALVRKRTEEIIADARRSQDSLESPEAYAADALVSLASDGGSTKAVVHVHVSATALERGQTIAGETCRIEGAGPITVASARRLSLNGFLKVLETDGVDVRRVAHAGRMIPARVRTALEARDRVCAVPECNRRIGLEIDHVVPFALGGKTEISNLVRLCRWHHAQKTHHGWNLDGSPGRWTWTKDRGG